MQAGAHFVYRPARGSGLEEQHLVQGLHDRALARLIGAAQQGEAGIELKLELLVQAHLAQGGVEQAHI